MKIEFFHDVICSFCFPMSYRMRQVQKKYPNIEIIHRSFALAWEEEDLNKMFGNRDNAKKEILGHWEHANQNDDLHRFNIEGMKKADFPFPTSKNGLLASKAAKLIGGEEAYWQVFDNIQEALFVNNKDIESMDVIKEAVLDADLNWDEFEKVFHSDEALEAVNEDLKLAYRYGIQEAPFLVINEKYGINGAQPIQVIEETIEKIAVEIHEPLTLIEDGQSCSLDENGTWTCD
ncbi:DsbA family protein [Vagococcus fluvialis]|uniref:DsbA family oxidoreductase n=1 Tax=Vagococcus fluvialis TaxID=2738 RepID=UPI0028921445|nr:DsbA family protein [Vagococcus fluvialis]MDT2781457.1 DsbA family protein [Vagococcus fluvialis]